MDTGDKIEQQLHEDGVVVDRAILRHRKIRGLYVGADGGRPPLVLLNGHMERREERCVLAEEAGHHYRSCGSALDSLDPAQRRNELAGRAWAYDQLVPLRLLIRAWRAGNRTSSDLADALDVTEPFLRDAIDYYHRKNGALVTCGHWVMQFDPYFDIYQVGEE